MTGSGFLLSFPTFFSLSTPLCPFIFPFRFCFAAPVFVSIPFGGIEATMSVWTRPSNIQQVGDRDQAPVLLTFYQLHSEPSWGAAPTPAEQFHLQHCCVLACFIVSTSLLCEIRGRTSWTRSKKPLHCKTGMAFRRRLVKEPFHA